MTAGASKPSDEHPAETLDDEVERLRALVAAIPDPIYRITADGTFVGVEVPDDHPEAVPQSTIPGQSVRSVMPPKQAEAVMAGIARALATGQMTTVEYHLTVADEHRWWEGRLVPTGGEVLAIVREITDRRRSESEALRRASTDPLTGLANRSVFDEAVEHALGRARRNGRPVALVFTDLDDFKAVNDTYGHVVGDAVLAEVGERFRALLRDGDLAARIGGDEIALLIEDFDSSHAVEAIGLRLVDAIAAPYAVDGREHRIGLSAGVAIFPDDAMTATELITVADAAMYRAKQRGGTQVAWGRHDIDNDID